MSLTDVSHNVVDFILSIWGYLRDLAFNVVNWFTSELDLSPIFNEPVSVVSVIFGSSLLAVLGYALVKFLIPSS